MEDVRVAIVGAGFGGLGAAIRLRHAGIDDVVVLERRDDVGGTWWDNTYPGCACDVPAHLYSFSFAQNPDWSRMFPEYRRVILNKLKTTGRMPDIEGRILFESALTPQDIHDRYRVLNGAIYGLASHGKWFGAFKPANRSRDVKGLYLAGGSAHPGPGMPMVLMSGWIAADALDQDGVAPKGLPRRLPEASLIGELVD